VDVSVITTTYNGLPFLPEAIRSVLEQTLADFEYIIVDDGSTDGTPEVVSGIADERVRYIRCQRIGRASALNVALREAKGCYLANLDSDDWMLPERLARQKAFLDWSPDVGMLGSAYYLRHPDGSEEEIAFAQEDAELRRRLYVGYPFIHSAVMYRRESLEATGGFDESLPCAIDYGASTRVALRAKLANLTEPLAVRRMHERSYFMSRISTRQYVSAFARIKWRYWNDSGRPLSLLPITVASLISGGVRKWLQR
jgi:glycosyltransferase EpsE